MAAITHTSYKCDKCGKPFDKRIEVKHSFPGPGYCRDRDDYVHVNFMLDIWYGGTNNFAVATTEPHGIDEACRHIRNFVEHKELPDEEFI